MNPYNVQRKVNRVSIREMVELYFKLLDPKLDHAIWGNPMTPFHIGRSLLQLGPQWGTMCQVN